MNFEFIPKRGNKPITDMAITFAGTRDEAFKRAKDFAGGLQKLYRGIGFTVRVERRDQPARPYEIGPDGKTVEIKDPTGPAT